MLPIKSIASVALCFLVATSSYAQENEFQIDYLYNTWVRYSGYRLDTIVYIPSSSSIAENMTPELKYSGISFKKDNTYYEHRWKMLGNDTELGYQVSPWTVYKMNGRHHLQLLDGKQTYVILELKKDRLILVPLPEPVKVEIDWKKSVPGDFSFKDNWSYPFGVFKNRFGQVSCEDFCPDEVKTMKDKYGKIYKDSLTKFYTLVDTTHLFYSIQCEARCYEWGGTDFITFQKINKKTVIGFTQGNVGTHSSLELTITGNFCEPVINLLSVVPSRSNNEYKYFCTGGEMMIDKTLWNQGIIKAEFNFGFYHQENPAIPFYWKGKIYAPILELKSNTSE